MKKIFNGLVLTMVLVFTGITCLAQDDGRTLYKQVAKLNQDAVDAIAMYPTETRKIIFEATEYPEVIAKLSAMQTNSQAAFEKLISNFSKEEQEKIWNLTRYDGLISDLAANPQMSQDEIDTILVNYPEEIHNTALEEIKNHYDLIIQIDKMNKNYGSDFELLMSGYPPEAITAFREIIKMPEVLDILFDHMQYTVVVGNYYKNNPERVLHKTDSLNLVLTQKNTQETNDWKQSLKDNPEVQKEYTEAAQEYAQDNGYQPADYNAPLTQDVTNYNTILITGGSATLHGIHTITGSLIPIGMIGDFIMARVVKLFSSDFLPPISWIGTFIIRNIVLNILNYPIIIIITIINTVNQ